MYILAYMQRVRFKNFTLLNNYILITSALFFTRRFQYTHEKLIQSSKQVRVTSSAENELGDYQVVTTKNTVNIIQVLDYDRVRMCMF